MWQNIQYRVATAFNAPALVSPPNDAKPHRYRKVIPHTIDGQLVELETDPMESNPRESVGARRRRDLHHCAHQVITMNRLQQIDLRPEPHARMMQTDIMYLRELAGIVGKSYDALDEFVEMCVPLRKEIVAWAQFQQAGWDRHLLCAIALAISVATECLTPERRDEVTNSYVNRLHLTELGMRERKKLVNLINKFRVEELHAKEEMLFDEIYALQRSFSGQVRNLDVGSSWYAETCKIFLRLSHLFVMLATLLFLVALLGGVLMQLFFDLLAHQMSNLDKYLLLFLFLFPGLIVLFALLLYETYQLSIGAFQVPSLPNCRSLMLVALGNSPSEPLIEDVPDEQAQRAEDGCVARGRSERSEKSVRTFETDRLRRDCMLVDFWFTWGLLLIVGSAMLYSFFNEEFGSGSEDGPLTRVYGSGIVGGLLWGVLTVIMAGVADVQIHYKWWTDEGKRARKFLKVVKAAVLRDNIEPGGMRKSAPAIMHAWKEYCISFCAQVDENDQAPVCVTRGGVIDWCGWFNGTLFVPFFVWWMAVLILAIKPHLTRLAVTYLVVGSLLFGVVFIMTYALGRVVPAVKRCSVFHGFTGFFLTLGVLMFYGLSYCLSPTPAEEDDPLTYMAVMNANVDPVFAHSSSPYTACMMRWGVSKSRINLLDLAALAQFSYVGSAAHYDKLLDTSFGGLAKREYFDVDSVFPRMIATRFKTNDPEGRHTVVISVKGTSTAQDVYTDFSLYSIVAVLQVLSHVMPLLDLMPNTFFAWLLYRLRLPDIWAEEKRIFDHALAVIQRVNTTQTSLVLTGHSLGGGITAALGAHLKIPTVVFSAPGGHFSRKRFGFTREQSYRNVLNIVPDTDIVPKVDRHDATVQHIICQDKDGVVRRPWECHFMGNTICELYRACGDTRGRDFTRACGAKIREEDLGAYVTAEEQIFKKAFLSPSSTVIT